MSLTSKEKVMSRKDELLSKMFCSYQHQEEEKKKYLHPIASDLIRPNVVEYLFACADEGVKENDCVDKLSNIFTFSQKCEECGFCEKETFEAAILFAFRTLKTYKEQFNQDKNEKDNLTDNSPCAGAE